MSQELIVLRHGKSDWNIDTDDFHRPLKKRGIRGSKQVVLWLQKQGWVPDTIISSPAKRALGTAIIVCEMMVLDEQCIQQEERLYGANLKRLMQVLSELSNDAKRVLLVGHNPGLEALLVYLSKKKIILPEDHKLLPTATLARLVIPTRWDKINKGCADLIEIKRPDKSKD
jgi:phosphohistidine phosphatase